MILMLIFYTFVLLTEFFFYAFYEAETPFLITFFRKALMYGGLHLIPFTTLLLYYYVALNKKKKESNK